MPISAGVPGGARGLRRGLAGCALGAAAGIAIGETDWAAASHAWPVALALLGLAMGVAWSRLSVAPSTSHGSARFASREEERAMGEEGGLIVGRSSTPDNGLLRYSGSGHLVTIAPTRAGKGAGAVVPNLLVADRPVLVIDPKGENFLATARTREKFGPVYRLDPFGVCGEASAGFNPLSGIRATGDGLIDDVATLADAIVADPPEQVREAHWNGQAKALVSGLLLHCLCNEREQHRTLARVREYLTLPSDGLRNLFEDMQESDAAGGLARRAANRWLAQNEREAASVLSTAQRHTHFLDSARIVRSTARSGFSFSEVLERNASVYLVLPPDRISAYARWLRIVVTQAVNEMVRLGPAMGQQPLLFLLDECAALGRMTALERAVGLMAGYGMQIWCIFQDLHQMRSTYGAAAGTLLSNAGLVQAFNVNDLETARWLSAVLGSATETYPSGSSSTPARTSRPLLAPDEILNLPIDKALLLRQNGRPVLCRKVRYYADPEFAELADPVEYP